ncbi:MAG TPA: response regulator transcription factor, partial [Dongiaceae bacterium]|nr:response regulator transcription factor [Dongiaceae bacterium]
MKKIALLLVDDHTVVRQGLRVLLEAEEDMEVIGEAENGRQAVVMAKTAAPDVVVMDVAMPLLSGLEATRQILKSVPGAKVLVLTSYGDDECVERLVQAGAAGFLMKQTAANDLLKAIREVHGGNTFFSPAIAKRLREQGREAVTSGQTPRKAGELTSRQAEVLQLIAEGFSN